MTLMFFGNVMASENKASLRSLLHELFNDTVSETSAFNCQVHSICVPLWEQKP